MPLLKFLSKIFKYVFFKLKIFIGYEIVKYPISYSDIKKRNKIFQNAKLEYNDKKYYYALKPLPNQKDLNSYYSQDYWDNKKFLTTNHFCKFRDFINFNIIRESVDLSKIDNKVFLNFGSGPNCSMSFFFRLLKWKVINIDLCDKIEFKNDPNWINLKTLSEVSDNSISFIYSSHSLEHVIDVEKYKEEFKKITNKENFIFIEVPYSISKPKIDYPHTYYFEKEFFTKYFFRKKIFVEEFSENFKYNSIDSLKYLDKDNISILRCLGTL